MIFISYSSRDYNTAQTIRKVLENNSIECWMAPESIPMGSDYACEIPDAIEKCSAFLLVLSKCAQESNWVPKELDLAITYNKVIIPFQIDDEMLTKPFNFRLTNVQRIEAFHNLEQAYDQLLGRIGVQTGLTRSDKVESELPEKYSYYQMLGISDISQVNIDNIRAANDVTVSMKVPIGINNKGEKVFLDLHQKGDGPNGLIVGPTGSGKSEFLLTLSLSLCLFFSSKEVRIHVIDLKGGGHVHALASLPHLGICLSQASDVSVEEFMSAIEKEVQHRYQILEQYSVSNIYQYLKLQKNSVYPMEDMPHMVIFFDEACDFKMIYPEIFFRLKELGSRMNATLLGIHLVFSTQSAYAFVDETVFNMSDFKICSRMQENGPASTMNNEISWCPGRLYLQSKSSSEVQLIQLAYCWNEIKDTNRDTYNWFFGKNSEKAELIDLIKRYELD